MTTQPPYHPRLPNRPDTLLIGIGNSGRRDDGLGWAFLDAVEREGTFCGEMQYCYQLQIEDAEMLHHFRHVIFVDAHQGPLDDGYQWRLCVPAEQFEFSTHVLSPEVVLYLCQNLYGTAPETWVLGIEGSVWGLGLGLSEEGRVHLGKALTTFHASLAAFVPV